MVNETTTSDAVQFQPNLSSKYSIVLDHPFSEVFRVIGTGDDVKALERMVRVSPLCTAFTILHRDTVALPVSTPLLRASVRTLPAHDPDKSVREGMALFPRQVFQFEETVKVLFGAVTTKVIVDACLSWDEENHVWLYESIVKKSGITIRKTREFEEIGGDKDGDGEGPNTRVKEEVEGMCSWWMKPIVQPELARAHREAMELYHTLF